MPDIALIIELLKQTTSISIVRDFLKAKNLKYSASSWDALYRDRILPSIENGQLDPNDLIKLLRNVEEYGHQHIFLYECTPEMARSLMDRSHVRRIYAREGIESVLDSPLILDQPVEPTITDVRWASAGAIDLSLTIKIIEQRTSQRYVGDEVSGNYILKRYERINERAVNIVKLHRDGLLELRITSQANSSNYLDNIRVLQGMVGLFPRSEFNPISLSTAKNRLWHNRAELTTLIRYSDSTLRNNNGTVLRAATGAESADLLQDTGAISSLNEFLNYEDAFCDGSNIWFKAQDPEPSKDIHVLLSGELNEFAVTANCTENDYGYVLKKLRALNS